VPLFAAKEEWAPHHQEAPRFAQRRGLFARRGWDLRLGDDDDAADIEALAGALGKDCAHLMASPDVSWHVLENTADERLLGCLATRLDEATATFEAVLVAPSSHEADVRAALVGCGEGAARCNGATQCRAREALSGYVEYDGLFTKTLGEPLPPPPPRWADDDDLAAQFEFAAGLGKVATDIANDLDDDPENEAPPPPAEDDESLEDLVGSLLTVLKTDKGKREFDALAERQRTANKENDNDDIVQKKTTPDKADYAALAPRAFVPRPASAAAGVTATVGNAKAFAELLASDSRFQQTLATENDAAAGVSSSGN